MTSRTVVALHEVDSEGSTGRPIGFGTLISPEIVLVHPPLNRALAADGEEPRTLRVALAAFDAATPVVEVIDGVGIDSWRGGDGTQLVAVDLARSALTPPTDIGMPAEASESEAARVLRQYLEQQGETQAPVGTPADADAGSTAAASLHIMGPICSLFPRLRPCQKNLR